MSRQFAITRKGSVPTLFVVPVITLMAIVTSVSLSLAWGSAQQNQVAAVGGLIDTTPVGASIQGYWENIPPGYVREDGTQYPCSGQYQNLCSVLGNKFGGDGVTTFNVPDSTGRVTVAKSATDVEFNDLTDRGGEKAHTLTAAELVHNHSIDHNHPGVYTDSQGWHNHAIYAGGSLFDPSDNEDPEKFSIVQVGDVLWWQPTAAALAYTEGDGNHQHWFEMPYFSGTSGTAGVASPTPHNNLQPYITARSVIRY